MIPLRDTIPSRTVPVVNYALIGLNVLAFLYELSLGSHVSGFLMALGVVPDRVLSAVALPQDLPGVGLTFLTSLFLHGGWLHLLGNMLYLYIFGDNVEDVLGHLRYLVFYLASGVAASLAHVALNPSSTVPTVGASGAIAGVLGAYSVLFPRSRVVTLVPVVFIMQVVELPAVLFLGFWFVLQFLSGSLSALSGGSAAGGVAWWAHIGGFVVGVGYALWRLGGFRRMGGWAR